MAKQMTKGQITKMLSEQHGLKVKACSELLDSFVEIACQEVKKTGVFTVPGLCRIKTRTKPATKAGLKKHLWQTSEGCCQACQESREGLPCGGLEATDLDRLCEEMQSNTSRGLVDVGMPRSRLGTCSEKQW